MAEVTVNLDDVTSTHTWDRLSVWSERDFTVPEFLTAVRLERKFQDTGARMRRWMAERGNRIMQESFIETLEDRQ